MFTVNAVRTSEEMRELVLQSLEALRDGRLDVEKCREINRGVAQVNESIYSEIKYRRTEKDLGSPVTGEFGSMVISRRASPAEDQ